MAEIVPGAPRGTPATKELLPVRDCGDAAEGAAALLPTDESPSKFSVASQEWPDADIQSQLCAFATDDGLAEGIEALMDGLPSPGPMGSDGAPKGTPRKQMVNALETQLLPVCGLASHEEGIQLLRACLATAREDPTYGGTETQSESPVWGCNDDWALLRPELEKRTAPLSPKLPTEVMALPAAFFRDPTFAVPDPEQDCVVVFGGVANVEGAGAGGCYFMPLLTQRQALSWHSSTSAHEK